MNSPKRILVATDFSETADAAFDYAIVLAKTLGASVVALHVYELPVFGFPDGVLAASPEVATSIMTAAQDALEAACLQRKSSNVDITQVVRQGVPWEEVGRVAEETSSDLIVVGTRGRRGLARAFIGSVAERIVRMATKPVCTVHGKETT